MSSWRARSPLLVPLLAVAIAATACGQTIDRGGGPFNGPGNGRASAPDRQRGGRRGPGGAVGHPSPGGGVVPGPSGGPVAGPITPASPPSTPPSTEPLPLGTFTEASVEGQCHRVERCQGFEVRCPDVAQAAQGVLGISGPQDARGVVALFAGGLGTSWWGTENEAGAEAMLEDLHRHGLLTVRVRWLDPWLYAAPGEQAGPALLGCRPATAIRWIHDHLYAPLHANPARGACGFCIGGDSGGASQVSYALADYGASGIVDAAAVASGPPHAGLAVGCLPGANAAGEHLAYTGGFSIPIIDGSYGFFGSGPCRTHDPAFASRWQADAIDTGGRDFVYPDTRVVFIFGAQDDSVGPPHGRLYLARLRASGSPDVSEQTVPGMGHLVANSASGLDAMEQVFLGSG